MFEKFLTSYSADPNALESKSTGDSSQSNDALCSQISDVFKFLGGHSYSRGLYRVYTYETGRQWTQIVQAFFPEFSGRFFVFGCDWMGRQFAADNARAIHGVPQVLLFDPGFNDALEIPVTVHDFHEVELLEYADAALATSMYSQWLANGGNPPAMNQCVGYRTPPWLGGIDEIENLELSDTEVYWNVLLQVKKRLS